MPPLPKDPKERRRRNRVAGATVLSAAAVGPAPKLPDPPLDKDGNQIQWHPMAVAWWSDLWLSPMSGEYHESDIHGLYLLLALEHQFWCCPDVKIAAEIRQQRQAYGLTPIDRRRLQWEIDRGESADTRTRQRRTPRAVGSSADPRVARGKGA